MQRQVLADFNFSKGFHAGSILDGGALDSYAEGSRNLLLLGKLAAARPWKGLQSKGASTGSRKMMQVGKTWGGIKDIGGTQGSGSFFEDFGRSLWMIGAGQPHVAGTDLTGITLSTTLKVAVAAAGVYSAANTFTAGLGQPSAPDVGILSSLPAGYTGLVNGPISVKIARFRATTGARSRASTTSVVITPARQAFYVVFPTAASGQDYWRVFVTQQGFGGVGLHYALSYNGSLDIPESVVAAGTSGGFSRALSFEFKDGDLVPETAYIDDYQPPAGTHAVRIENSMVVLGCYGDSSSAVSSTSTGTCGAVSLPNFFESYRPRDLVYFPEQVVDVLSRPSDSYAYVAHKNSISSLQYVGLRDGPAVAATTVWSDVGIQYPHNWTQVHGKIYCLVGKGSLVRMRDDGSPDYSWGAELRDYIENWLPADTVLGWHPDTLSVVVMNGSTAFSYSLENEQWSPACFLSDAGVSGSALSCVNSQGELVLSVNNGGSHTAYSWDAGASSMPVTSITNWRRGARPATLMEALVSFETDAVSVPLVVSLHANRRRTYVRDLVTTSGSNTVSSATAKFDANHTGDLLCVFGANVGGAGVNYLIGRMTYVSATQVTLTHPTTGATLNASASLTGCYALLAHDIAAVTLSATGPQHTPPLTEMMARDCLSFAVGVNMVTAASSGCVDNVTVWGTIKGEGVSRTV